MPSFATIRRVRHSAADMFALVADVQRYPEFVPLCHSLSVASRRANGEGEEIIARMTVAYKVFRESFTSRVRLRPEERTILVEYLDGPFRKLDNRWRFIPLSERSCDVEFHIAYEFRSMALQLVMGAVFDKAFGKFAEAFEQRADVIYGRNGAG